MIYSMKFKNLFIIACLLAANVSIAAEKALIRIGVQTFGTVDWELTAIAPADDASYQLEITHVANAEAGKIALQSGAVDMIVADWVWVAKLRASGNDFNFYPYSTTSGAVVIPDDSPIKTLADLKGKRLGIGGGELDKNWLLLQALAKQQGFDLAANVEKTFAAPPLISEQLKQKRVDAALTYWHFAARLQTQGFKQLLDGKAILQGLGIKENIPAIGYVFKQSWATEHKIAVNQFLADSKQAKNRLCTDDSAWQKIIPFTKTDDTATQTKLRTGYCDGGINQWTDQEQQAIARVYKLLHGISPQLTGDAGDLPAGMFWQMAL